MYVPHTHAHTSHQFNSIRKKTLIQVFWLMASDNWLNINITTNNQVVRLIFLFDLIFHQWSISLKLHLIVIVNDDDIMQASMRMMMIITPRSVVVMVVYCLWFFRMIWEMMAESIFLLLYNLISFLARVHVIIVIVIYCVCVFIWMTFLTKNVSYLNKILI